jgi:hypothetical protein
MGYPCLHLLIDTFPVCSMLDELLDNVVSFRSTCQTVCVSLVLVAGRCASVRSGSSSGGLCVLIGATYPNMRWLPYEATDPSFVPARENGCLPDPVAS